MDLLHAQFNNGPLSLEEIKTCLGSDFGAAWPTIQKKFKQTDKSLFFNERAELEKNKRKNFCESRRKNKLTPKKPTHDTTYDEHMIQHMENRNRNIVFKEGVTGEDVFYSIEHCLFLAMKDDRWVNVNKATDIKLKAFNRFLEGQGVYDKNPGEYKKHYHNWQNKQTEKPKEYQPASTAPTLKTLS